MLRPNHFDPLEYEPPVSHIDDALSGDVDLEEEEEDTPASRPLDFRRRTYTDAYSELANMGCNYDD